MSWRKVLEDTSLLKVSRKLKLSLMTVSVQPESLFRASMVTPEGCEEGQDGYHHGQHDDELELDPEVVEVISLY